MYQLWGGGAPFSKRKDGDLTDSKGTHVNLLGDVRRIMHMLKTDPAWTDTVVAVASCCDEPEWARECISKFEIGDGLVLGDVIKIQEIYKGKKKSETLKIQKIEIHTPMYRRASNDSNPFFWHCEGSKSGHLKTIAEKVGCSLEEIIFLDNERRG